MPIIKVLSKYLNNIKSFPMKFSFFTSEKKVSVYCLDKFSMYLVFILCYVCLIICIPQSYTDPGVYDLMQAR